MTAPYITLFSYGDTKRESVAGNSNREIFFNCVSSVYCVFIFAYKQILISKPVAYTNISIYKMTYNALYSTYALQADGHKYLGKLNRIFFKNTLF